MNRSFDYNGVQIAPSKPVQKLRTVRKVLHIDSADRDIVQYPRNGDFVVYLPRAYEKVVSLNVKSAEFPPLGTAFATGTAYLNIWDNGLNTCVGQTGISASAYPSSYFLLEIEGLNKADETARSADRSALTDSVFAKFPVVHPTGRNQYNESSNMYQSTYFQPAISKLDRLHLTTRFHGMPRSQYIFWPNTQAGYGVTGPLGDWNYSLTLEIETLENSFDDFSSIETRIGDRSGSGFLGC